MNWHNLILLFILYIFVLKNYGYPGSYTDIVNEMVDNLRGLDMTLSDYDRTLDKLKENIFLLENLKKERDRIISFVNNESDESELKIGKL